MSGKRSNVAEAHPVIDRINAAQSMILVRSLIGVLVETRQWLTRKETNDLISKYMPMLPPDARKSYAKFNRLFGKSSLARVRNSFGYHFPSSVQLNAALIATPDDEDFNWYVTEEHTTSFYFGCEAVVGHGAVGLSKGADGVERVTLLLSETRDVANELSHFLSGLLTVSVTANQQGSPAGIFEVPDAPGPESFLPFYFDGLLGKRSPEE